MTMKYCAKSSWRRIRVQDISHLPPIWIHHNFKETDLDPPVLAICTSPNYVSHKWSIVQSFKSLWSAIFEKWAPSTPLGSPITQEKNDWVLLTICTSEALYKVSSFSDQSWAQNFVKDREGETFILSISETWVGGVHILMAHYAALSLVALSLVTMWYHIATPFDG
jgi:hypothetical protein